jgi:hypothetical protein
MKLSTVTFEHRTISAQIIRRIAVGFVPRTCRMSESWYRCGQPDIPGGDGHFHSIGIVVVTFHLASLLKHFWMTSVGKSWYVEAEAWALSCPVDSSVAGHCNNIRSSELWKTIPNGAASTNSITPWRETSETFAPGRRSSCRNGLNHTLRPETERNSDVITIENRLCWYLMLT